MKHLIFDVDISGHHTEYLKHLVIYINETDTDDEFIFAVHEDFFIQCLNIISINKKRNVSFIGVSKNKLEKRNIKNRIKRSLYNFSLMHEYAISFKADIVYLMHLNVFQIALGLKKYPYKIRGILFMQFTNMRVSSIRSFYYYIRRYFPFILMNNNRNKLDKVFVLNDSETALLLNRRYKTNIYEELPDPINFELPEHIDIRLLYNIPPKAEVLLHFGSLAERKGTLEAVRSLEYLPKEKSFVLLVVGRSKDKSFVNVLETEIQKINRHANITCIWDNNFVTDGRVSALFQQSDVVLMPYKNPEASSGILGHAIAHKRKVISPSGGLLGTLVNQLGLGITLLKIEPIFISEAINKIKDFEINDSKCEWFYQLHTPIEFARKLLWK